MTLIYHKLIKWIILLTIFCAGSTWASIGNVDKIKGNVAVDRKDGDKGVILEKDNDIFSYDTLKTGNGKVGVLFLDDTRVDLTEHSKLVIDEFVYDPNSKKGKLSLGISS